MRVAGLAAVAFATVLVVAGCGGTQAPGESKAGVPTATSPATAGTDGARLPAVLAVARADEATAAELARITLHGTDATTRLAALLTALQHAGIAVRDPLQGDGVVREAHAPAQGTAVMIAEAVAMERLLQRGHQVALADIAELIVQAAAREGVDLRQVPVESLLLEGLHRTAGSGTPTQRFWVAFLRELGRQGATGRDLLDRTPDGPVMLDAAQAGLIMLRLAAEFTAHAPSATPATQAATATARWPDALLALGGISAAHAQDAPAAPAGDCRMGDGTSAVMDAAMAGANKVFEQLMEAFGERLAEGAASAVRKFKHARATQAIAGNLLGIVKMFVVGSLTEARVEFDDGGNHLVRTRHRHIDDELKVVRATLRLNAGGWQAMNCYRILLAGVGMDFNVGNDGAIAGSTLQWRIVQGGVESRLQGKPADPGLIRFEGKTRTVTDAQGQGSVMVVGRRQAYTVPSQAPTVEKPATVRVEYTLKETDLYKDLFDSLLGLLGGPVSITVELLQRMVPQGTDFHFPVVDYAADYRIDHLDPATGVRLQGRKCGGPAGRWDITFSGNLGGMMAVEGESVVELDYEGKGRWVTDTRTSVPADAEGLVAIPPARTRGSATLSPDGLQLRLSPAGSDATVRWAGKQYAAAASRDEVIPLTVGSFCK